MYKIVHRNLELSELCTGSAEILCRAIIMMSAIDAFSSYGLSRVKVTGYSLLINYSWAISIHCFAKSECWMELSLMVLCKIDKPAEVLSLLAKVEGGI